MKYTAGAVYDAIDALAPFGSCMEWDNVGLLVGSPAALRAATCGRRSPCLYPDFQLFRQPSSSKIRSAAASASRSDVYGTSLKRRFPETIAERRRLSFGRYRIYTGSPSASALPSS